MATRERATAMWTGDTWKLVCCLKAFRPDLEVSTIAVKNTGLAIIRNLDPSNRVLFDRYDEALAQFLPLEFDYIDGRQEEALGLIPVDLPAIRGMIPQFPARPGRVAQRQRYPRSLPIMRHRARVFARVSARRVQRAGQALISRARSGSTVPGREDAGRAQ